MVGEDVDLVEEEDLDLGGEEVDAAEADDVFVCLVLEEEDVTVE